MFWSRKTQTDPSRVTVSFQRMKLKRCTASREGTVSPFFPVIEPRVFINQSVTSSTLPYLLLFYLKPLSSSLCLFRSIMFFLLQFCIVFHIPPANRHDIFIFSSAASCFTGNLQFKLQKKSVTASVKCWQRYVWAVRFILRSQKSCQALFVVENFTFLECIDT